MRAQLLAGQRIVSHLEPETTLRLTSGDGFSPIPGTRQQEGEAGSDLHLQRSARIQLYSMQIKALHVWLS